MTLVVRSRNYSAPTMMGDLLLSKKIKSRSMVLPAVGRDVIPYLKPSTYYPSGLAQKLYIMGKNVCMAFSGDVGEIMGLLEDFRPFCSAGPSAAQIRRFAEEYDYSNFIESSYLMMIIEDDDGKKGDYKKVLEISYGNTVTEGAALFNQLCSSGSGSEAFSAIVHEPREFQCSFSEEDPRHPLVVQSATIGRLLADERYFLGPTHSHFGGGYELVYYNGERLEKVDNIAYLMHTGRFADDGGVGIDMPIMINHYRYQGDDLLITSLELFGLDITEVGDIVSMRSNRLRESCICVPQIRRGECFEPNSHPVASFETCKVAMGFVIGSPSQRSFNPSIFSGAALVVKYTAEKQQLEITVHRDFRAFIGETFRSAYPRYRTA